MGTVLVIDDHETVRLGISKIVDRMGHHGLTACSGAEGLEFFHAEDVDFVITDLKMEGLDGMEFLTQVKDRSPDTEVIVITGFATMETAKESFKKGVFDFLAKPFKLGEIAEVIRRAEEKGRR